MPKRKRLFSSKVKLAPVNPDFQNYTVFQSKQEADLLLIQGRKPGFIPPPLNLSHLKGKTLFQANKPLAFLPNFDLRKEGKLSPIQDQGAAGTCWAFATYGSLESYLLPQQEWNFSENNMKNLMSENCPEGYDRQPDGGGNQFISTAYLARWNGPVLEAEDPYDAFNASCSEYNPRKHIQQAVYIPDRNGALDNNNIKKALVNYGAVFTSMFYDDASYNPDNYSYYYRGTSFSNHAICLVGWDDNYDRNKFINPPAGKGAYIGRNSWGSSWGDKGYFYISYYDSRIGSNNVLFNNAEDPNNYGVVHQYDPLGWVASAGYNSPSAWFGNVFTAENKETLAAVSWYVGSPNADYQLMVYTNPQNGNPRSGVRVKNLSGVIAEPGYYTKVFKKPYTLSKDLKFSVLVRLTTPGYNYPIPLEMAIPGYSSKASSSQGQSFISRNGRNWEEPADTWDNANVCIKAFANIDE
ncbi:MAG: lectin like domain-containing protein [Syntrophomonadaceae bacterium]|nr:lectin like domain-containing protein [Syntrophomonadaceae bacterium]